MTQIWWLEKELNRTISEIDGRLLVKSRQNSQYISEHDLVMMELISKKNCLYSEIIYHPEYNQASHLAVENTLNAINYLLIHIVHLPFDKSKPINVSFNTYDSRHQYGNVSILMDILIDAHVYGFDTRINDKPLLYAGNFNFSPVINMLNDFKSILLSHPEMPKLDQKEYLIKLSQDLLGLIKNTLQ